MQKELESRALSLMRDPKCLDEFLKRGIIVKCDYCGKDVSYRSKTAIARAKNHFCSAKCYGNWRSLTTLGSNNTNWKRVPITCDCCHIVFEDIPCHIQSGDLHFCSAKCRRKYNKDTGCNIHKLLLKCHWCNKDIQIWPSKLRARNYCSSSCASKERMQNLELVTKVINAMKTALEIKPNSKEVLLDNIINRNFMTGWKYVGDGKFWIGNTNPDFINSSTNSVIEMLGCYWHGCKIHCPSSEYIDNSIELVQHYNKFGYNCLIIWEHELSDENAVAVRLEEFATLCKRN
jgi:G:T-mismatch repair DNA endonuclease (very short patch repair protein)